MNHIHKGVVKLVSCLVMYQLEVLEKMKAEYVLEI